MDSVKENKMGCMPENRLLLSMALPMILSMLVQACYNVVDSVFVAWISEDALTAVSLAFPIQNIMISVAVGTGVGMNALLSRALGAGNRDQIKRIAGTGMFLSVCSCLVFMLLALVLPHPFYASQVRDYPEIMGCGVEYLTIVCLFSQGLFLQICKERHLQSSGHTVASMVSQLCGAVTNIVLDPLLIFGIGIFPRMEVKGAAIATVIGQMVGAVTGILLNRHFNHEVQITLSDCLHPNRETVGRIYSVGVPSIIMSSIGSVMTYGMNRILVVFSSTATAVFGAYFKLQSFFFMPVFGLTHALVSIIAFNYGAGKRKRMVKTIRLGMLYATAFTVAGLITFQLVPTRLLGLFKATDALIAIGVPCLRTISISFLFAGFCIVGGTVFQALGNGVYSMAVSVIRQLLVLLPAAWLLAQSGNVDMVWWSFPIAEIASLTVTVIFLRRINRQVISKVPE